MSDRNALAAPVKKGNVKNLLDNILDFGPDSAPPSETAERLKRLVKQLEDLNSRIEKLSARY